ncbi:MAG: hypothetical protein M1834_002323 [Cirrosporium novae-zelandiae]|nr:MAG: hypothetical protein M1834_002323 [Cirrosporium novae-zelandiae]
MSASNGGKNDEEIPDYQPTSDQKTEKGAGDVSEYETTPTFGQRVKKNLKRFWWLYLIVLIIIVLIIVLLIVYVAYPKIAQSDINKSTLYIQSQAFTDPTTSSIRVTQHGFTHSSSSYHPQLDSWNASLYVGAATTPFAYVQIPHMHATSTATQDINQTLQISHLGRMTSYVTTVLGSAEYQLRIKGRVKLHEMAFPATTVDYDKTVTLKGLNGLKGLKIVDFNLMGTTDAEGHNVNGTLMIPNPSNMTIELGNVTTYMYLPSLPTTPIGTALIPSLTLTPGNNTYAYLSTTNESLVLTQITKTYTDMILPITIVGKSAVNDAGEHLEYFEKGLRENVIKNVSLDASVVLGSLFG